MHVVAPLNRHGAVPATKRSLPAQQTHLLLLDFLPGSAPKEIRPICAARGRGRPIVRGGEAQAVATLAASRLGRIDIHRSADHLPLARGEISLSDVAVLVRRSCRLGRTRVGAARAGENRSIRVLR